MTTDQQPEDVGEPDAQDAATPPTDDRQKAAEAYQQMGATPPAPAEEREASDLPSPDPLDDELADLLADSDRAGDEAAGEPAEDPRSKEQLVADLGEAQDKLAETQDDLLRTAAEFANYRRRAERDAAQGRIAGRADVLASVLDVLDDFDRTIAAAADSPDEGLRSGVSMVHGKLVNALSQHGLVRVDEVGADFDPNRHEAVQKVEAADGPLEAERVQQVFRPGYLHGDRVLRAAMVVVEQ